MDLDKMCNLKKGPSIDASYQVSVHLVKRFQRKRFLEIDPQAILVSDWLISKKSAPLLKERQLLPKLLKER
jgi:hypothetical protein